MDPVRHISGRAIPFGRKNVDTDVVIPAHWLKTISREGLGKGAFEAVRKELQNGLERAERLRRAARLSNADEPVNRFEARPAAAPGRGERR